METDYYQDKPWSFGDLKQIKNSNPDFKHKEIDKFLIQNEIYTRFRGHRKPLRYSPIYVYRKRELFQADVVFFTNKHLVDNNNGYKYLFTCIDCFTKMAWVYPMKANTCANVMQCFQDILKKCGRKPERLNSDRGSELICKSFEGFLADQDIFHYLSYSLRKCPIVERFNLTFQQLLYKIMASKRSWKWTDYIEQAMKIYLNRKHSTIGMSPVQAEKENNAAEVRQNLFKFFQKGRKIKSQPKYKLNDTVRIWKEKHIFQRGYSEKFSREFFKIIKILQNLPVPRYVLADSAGEVIKGKFFEDELTRFEPSDLFEIEVLRTRKRRKKIEYLVHYIGYPSSMDQWIPKKNLEKL